MAAVRLHRLEADLGDDLVLEWRSFLLRPQPAEPPRTLEQFRSYTESWRRAADEEPAAGFRVWSTDEGPPSHSVPPHLVAKAAARLGGPAFQAVHRLLLESYFSRNRDITSSSVLREIWSEAGLPCDQIASWQRPDLLEAVIRQHNEAIEHGAGGVPAVRMEGSFGVVTGAQPLEAYRDWVNKALAAV